MANTAAQFGAIQQGASGNSLVNQLFAGRTAAASKVKSPNTPSFGFTSPAPVSPITPKAPNMSTVNGPAYAPPPVIPSPTKAPVNQPIKNQTVTTPDGTTHSTTYHAPDKQPTAASTSQPTFNEGDHAVIPTTAQGSQPPAPTPAPAPTPTNTPAPVAQPNNLNTAVGGLFNTAQSNPTIGKSAADIAKEYAGKIADTGILGANVQAGDLSTGTNVVGEGNAAIASQSASQRVTALANAEEAALQGTGQQLTAAQQQANALNQAGALSTPINQFAQVPYSNQIVGPDGKPISGSTAGTLPQAAQDFVTSLAKQVQNGAMTRADAESRLTAYGIAGVQALNSALGPNFNTNASNASAATTATGQQIQTAADSTNKALDSLSTSFDSLNKLQTGGIPLTNSIAQWIATNLGDPALQQYKTNLADARSQLIGVLNSAGGTPTGNEATANEYLPDNMTPQQFQQNVGTAQNPGIVRQLIAQKVSSFTTSGQQNKSNAQSNGTITWDSIVK